MCLVLRLPADSTQSKWHAVHAQEQSLRVYCTTVRCENILHFHQTVTGRFGPIPVRTPGRFGPIPFRSGRFGPGRFGPI